MAQNAMHAPEQGVRSSLFRDLPTMLEGRNVALDVICANAGLSTDTIVEGDDFIALHSASLILEGCASALDDPHFALRYSKFVAPGATGLLGQLQATAPTVREMMETTVRFSELSLRPVVPEWEDYGENGIFSARLPVNNIMSIRQLTDLLMAVLVDRIRLAAGANWAPRDICFETTKPPMSRIYYDIFGDGLRFGEPTFSITIERGVMDRQMPNNILGLHNTILPLAEEALADLRKREGFKGTVAGEIRRQLSSDRDARISLASVAEGIGLSGRALQWRLTQDGSDYHTVLGEVREEIALKLLEETKMQIADIAIAIGFAETSVFTRWAIRTLGDRPSAIRRKMEKGTWSGPTPQPDGKPASATADTSSDTT